MSEEETQTLLQEVNAILSEMVANDPWASELIRKLNGAGIELYLTATKAEPQKEVLPSMDCVKPKPLVRNGKVLSGTFTIKDICLLGACGISL